MLTEAQVRSAKPGASPRKLFDARGLYLHVMPNGGKYWRFNFRFKGKYKTLSLGVYPDVPLAKARERHQNARQLLADKVDPCVEKKASTTPSSLPLANGTSTGKLAVTSATRITS